MQHISPLFDIPFRLGLPTIVGTIGTESPLGWKHFSILFRMSLSLGITKLTSYDIEE